MDRTASPRWLMPGNAPPSKLRSRTGPEYRESRLLEKHHWIGRRLKGRGSFSVEIPPSGELCGLIRVSRPVRFPCSALRFGWAIVAWQALDDARKVEHASSREKFPSAVSNKYQRDLSFRKPRLKCRRGTQKATRIFPSWSGRTMSRMPSSSACDA